MPSVDIEIVLRPGEVPPPNLARRLADGIGKVFGSPPGTTWVKLHFLPREQYAENAVSLPDDLAPVFVSILKAQSGDAAALQHEIAQLTPLIASLTARSAQNVHILYQPAGSGRIAFGGSLR